MECNYLDPRGPSPKHEGWFTTHLHLDESLLDMLDKIINPMEEPMFNPFVAEDNTFTVEFIKTDGSHGKITGRLVAPNYEGSKLDLVAYLAKLSDQDHIPVYTDKGWRSFYTSKVFYFKLEV